MTIHDGGFSEGKNAYLGMETGNFFGEAKIIELLGAGLSEHSKFFFDAGKEFPSLAKNILSIFHNGRKNVTLEGQFMSSLQMQTVGAVPGLDTKEKKDKLLVEIRGVISRYNEFLRDNKKIDLPIN